RPGMEHPDSKPRAVPFWIALGIAGLQVAFALLAAGNPDLPKAYRALLQWDSRWYESIAAEGYHSVIPPVAERPERANVAFFPGYPLVARGFARAFGLESGVALLLAAQAGAVLFWWYFILLLEGLGLPRGHIAAGVIAVAVHPVAFFLVAG